MADPIVDWKKIQAGPPPAPGTYQTAPLSQGGKIVKPAPVTTTATTSVSQPAPVSIGSSGSAGLAPAPVTAADRERAYQLQRVLVEPTVSIGTQFSKSGFVSQKESEITYAKWIQQRMGVSIDFLRQQAHDIDPTLRYNVTLSSGKTVELPGGIARIFITGKIFQAEREHRKIGRHITGLKESKVKVGGEKAGTFFVRTSTGYDVGFDPKVWESAEDVRASRDQDWGYFAEKAWSKFISRGDYTMESLRSGTYTPEQGLRVGGEKLDPRKFGKDWSGLSKGHYEFSEMDWGGKFVKSITSEPVMMVITGGTSAGLSAIGYTGFGSRVVGSLGGKAITGSSLATGAVTGSFITMGAIGTVSTYQQGGMSAVEEQMKRAGVMSPLFIGAWQTGQGYGGQVAYTAWKANQRLGIPRYPLRTGWGNIGKFTPTSIKNIYNKYQLAKTDVVRYGSQARVGSDYGPTFWQRVKSPYYKTSNILRKVTYPIRTTVGSGVTRFKNWAFDPRYKWSYDPQFKSVGPEKSTIWKPMASQREMITSWEQLRGKRIDPFMPKHPTAETSWGWNPYVTESVYHPTFGQRFIQKKYTLRHFGLESKSDSFFFYTKSGLKFFTTKKSGFTFGKIVPIKTDLFNKQIGISKASKPSPYGMSESSGKIIGTSPAGEPNYFFMMGRDVTRYGQRSFFGVAQTKEIPTSFGSLPGDVVATETKGYYRYFSKGKWGDPQYSRSVTASKQFGGTTASPGRYGFKTVDLPKFDFSISRSAISNIRFATNRSLTFFDFAKKPALDFGGGIGTETVPKGSGFGGGNQFSDLANEALRIFPKMDISNPFVVPRGYSLAQLEFLESGVSQTSGYWGGPSLSTATTPLTGLTTTSIPSSLFLTSPLSLSLLSQHSLVSPITSSLSIQGLGLSSSLRLSQSSVQSSVQSTVQSSVTQQSTIQSTIQSTVHPTIQLSVPYTTSYIQKYLSSSLPSYNYSYSYTPKPPRVPRVPWIPDLGGGTTKKGEPKKEQVYDVYVKDRYIVKGKKKYREKFVKLGDNFSEMDALAFGATTVDNSAARTFKIVPSSGKLKQPRISTSSWSSLQNKFYPSKKGYVERVGSAIDSPGELREISARGWVAEKRKMYPKKRRAVSNHKYKTLHLEDLIGGR